MSYSKKSLIQYSSFIIIGILLLILTYLSKANAAYKIGFYVGLSAGPVFTGIVGCLITLKNLKNPQKLKKMALTKSEERIEYIRIRSYSSGFRVIFLIESLAMIITLLFNYYQIAITINILLVIKIILFFIFCTFYNKKF